uniref:Pyridoxamine 5'-phosphate oxidase family protein n=1 Tax=Panagrellus redivivus TaxID=6233 RepID=A0A7E4VH95_PANRE
MRGLRRRERRKDDDSALPRLFASAVYCTADPAGQIEFSRGKTRTPLTLVYKSDNRNVDYVKYLGKRNACGGQWSHKFCFRF